MSKTLYARLGGYDGIAAVADDLLPRLVSDPQLERFWKHRGEDGVRREKQLQFRVATNEKADVLAFIESTKKDIVE